MLNQTNPNASSGVPKETTAVPIDFTIHTMQSDLENLKNNPSNATLKINPTLSANIISAPNNVNSPFIKPALPGSSSQEKIIPTSTPPIEKKEVPDGKTLYKIIFLIIILAVIAVMGFGFYYVYTTTKNSKKSVTTTENTISKEEQPPQQNLPTEEPVIITPTLEKYSIERPNFLPLDLSSASLADLESQFFNLTEELKISPTGNLYEFIIVDKNNNPIDFKSFMQAIRITLSPSILNSLTKDFSLFCYNDNGNIRLGLAIKTLSVEKTKLSAAMRKQEATLVNDLNFLFLKNPISDSNRTFTLSDYSPNKEVVRYLNLNNEKTLSIDYTVTTTKLLLSTSKQTLRALYQKINPTENPTLKNDLSAENNATPISPETLP